MSSDENGIHIQATEFRLRMQNLNEVTSKERSNGNLIASSFVEKPLCREDSLQNIAIKYGVKVLLLL